MAQVVVGRKNQFFLPGDGIDREVIQADICKYLDNDATVRPGEYNGGSGFYIFAYRNLTTEQVKDIQADSSKLKRERQERQEKFKTQINRKRGRDPPPAPAPVSYTESTTHSQSAQRHEEQERERRRLRSESPTLPFQGHQPPRQNQQTGLPSPLPPRVDQTYPISPPGAQAYHAHPRPHDEYTPPYTSTPESQYSQPSTASYGSRSNYEDQYQQFPSPQASYPGPPQMNAGRPYIPPPPPPQQQMASQMPRDRTDNYYNDYDDAMDTGPEPYYQDHRMPGRSERMDGRMDRTDMRSEYSDRDRDRDMRDDRDMRADRAMRTDRDMRGERDMRDPRDMQDTRTMAPPSRMAMPPPPRMEPPSIVPQQRSATRMDMRPQDPTGRSESRMEGRPYPPDNRFAPYGNKRGGGPSR